jgi:hypothetical protein
LLNHKEDFHNEVAKPEIISFHARKVGNKITENTKISILRIPFPFQLTNTMEFLTDIWNFLLERRKWWLTPILLVLLLIGILLFVAEGSAVGSFIYTLF